jgi:hypothetical protein
MLDNVLQAQVFWEQLAIVMLGTSIKTALWLT